MMVIADMSAIDSQDEKRVRLGLTVAASLHRFRLPLDKWRRKEA